MTMVRSLVPLLQVLVLFPLPFRSSLAFSPVMLGQLSRFSTRAFMPTSRGSAVAVAVTTSSASASSSSSLMRLFSRKAGVASPEELKDFVAQAGNKLLVVDVRNPDADVEPGDQKSLAVAPLPSEGVRPRAVSLIWDREANSMPLPPTDDKETPIITHCGGGGRGQMAKDFLMEKGFKNVLNGGGPKETDCWAEYGEK